MVTGANEVVAVSRTLPSILLEEPKFHEVLAVCVESIVV